MPGGGQHSHSIVNGCYEEVKELTCGYPEQVDPAEHVHTDSCYKTSQNLICTIPEHTHTPECFPNTELDSHTTKNALSEHKSVVVSSMAADTVVKDAQSLIDNTLKKEDDSTSESDQSSEVAPTIKAVEGLELERTVPNLSFVAVEENKQLLDYYLSSKVRVLVPVDAQDKSFVQAKPTDKDNPNDSFYIFGYAAPKDADKQYEAQSLVIYSAYGTPMEYPDKVVISYRVFGSLDGKENAWYVCDEQGAITHKVEEKEVKWNTARFDMLKAGSYTLTGEVDSSIKTEEGKALVAEIKVEVTEVPEMPELDHGHDHA